MRVESLCCQVPNFIEEPAGLWQECLCNWAPSLSLCAWVWPGFSQAGGHSYTCQCEYSLMGSRAAEDAGQGRLEGRRVLLALKPASPFPLQTADHHLE